MTTEELLTAPHVELDRYLGLWFEIARKPMRHEDVDARDITAEYSLNEDGSVRVLNSCINADGKLEQSEGTAKAVDETNAKLEVSFLPQGLQWIPFTKGDYWIIKVDGDYQTALVGDPQRKYLWLLHRQGSMRRDDAMEWLEIARARGYDLSDIIWPSQSGAVYPAQDAR